MRTITKKELVVRAAKENGVSPHTAKEVIQVFMDTVIEELAAGNRLQLRQFGVFEVKNRAARRAQNPRTLERVDVPQKRIVKFKAGRTMQQRVAENHESALEPGLATFSSLDFEAWSVGRVPVSQD